MTDEIIVLARIGIHINDSGSCYGCRAAPVRGAAQVAVPSYEVGTSMNASAAEASSSLQRHHPVWAAAATYR
jgi:hypothetical protein